MPIRPYLDGHRFDAETTRLMGIAFETAIQALHCRGVVDPPREAIAKAIIDLAQAGERDPERLCDLALEECSISGPNPPLPPASPQEPAGSRTSANPATGLTCSPTQGAWTRSPQGPSGNAIRIASLK